MKVAAGHNTELICICVPPCLGRLLRNAATFLYTNSFIASFSRGCTGTVLLEGRGENAENSGAHHVNVNSSFINLVTEFGTAAC